MSTVPSPAPVDEDLGVILARFSFRKDPLIPLPHVWVRGRRNGRRFTAYADQTDGSNTLTVSWTKAGAARSETFDLDVIVVDELETELHRIIRS